MTVRAGRLTSWIMLLNLARCFRTVMWHEMATAKGGLVFAAEGRVTRNPLSLNSFLFKNKKGVPRGTPLNHFLTLYGMRTSKNAAGLVVATGMELEKVPVPLNVPVVLVVQLGSGVRRLVVLSTV